MTDFDKIDEEFLRKRSALKWGLWDRETIPLSVADLDFPAPDIIKEAVIRAVREDRTPYSNYGGDPDVLETVCEKLRTRNNIPAEPDDVHMVPGTMFAIFLACYYALGQGDEAIICPAPIYPPFMENVQNAGGVPVYNPIRFDENLRIDLDDLRSRITPLTRLIMLSNPHNPTGRVLTRSELEGIGQIAQEHDLLIFSDELYEDMIFEGQHISIASLSPDLFERTITVFGFSKAFGIPGYRIAYIVCHGRHMQELKKLLHGIIVHADTLSQAAAKAALEHGEPWLRKFMAHLRRMRDYGVERLSAIPGVNCHVPEATPFLFPNISSFGKTSEEMVRYLKNEAKVIVVAGTDFGPHGEGYIRINFATDRKTLEEAFDRIEKTLTAGVL
ncbi:MAG: pyridoxal phosphate-dependent aminotransferase [Deltaproteobacteria bacterium]|nr:pyridoxal phosphate-dependent aminotransferase [Deltaproteobacteria bacterium]MBW2129005.1 pyridoxal phosphate-dependent aminotransferase [Deltaproteobacteria bacterium]MBW2302900.1 pyridoxal phosphate-dependent aminotransferase [Deltaproteobacteria bacterium]